MDLSQSNLTAQVQKLERQVAARLFDRGNRGLTLTERGATLLSYARRILALAREAEDAVRTSRANALTIAAHEGLTIYRLPEVLTRLRAIEPDTTVKITSVEERELASVEAIKRCALLGLGYAVLPHAAVAKELAGGEIFELQPPSELGRHFRNVSDCSGEGRSVKRVRGDNAFFIRPKNDSRSPRRTEA